MRVPTPLQALSAVAAITLLAGCSGGSSQVVPLAGGNGTTRQSVLRQLGNSHSVQQTKSWMTRPDMLARLTYISDNGANNVTVFSRNGVMQGQIGGLSSPDGIFVDADRSLWVANSGANNVLKFKRGATMPSKTLNDPGGGPNDVTICPNDTVYVSGYGSVSIEVYASGSTNPTSTLSFPSELQNDFLTCDAAGNVFATIVDGSFHGGVVEYPGGNQSGATQLPISLQGPGGIKQDNAGNLLITDQSVQTITEYTEAGVPTGNSIHTGFDCLDLGVSKDGRVVGCALYVANGTSEGQSYTFPAGAIHRTYSGSFILPYGFGFDPNSTGL
jgi:hypothetical protein